MVDYAPSILELLAAVPGLKQVSEVVIRETFFKQVRLLVFIRSPCSLLFPRTYLIICAMLMFDGVS